MQPHHAHFRNQCPLCASALFVYNFMRQDLHKELGAEVVTPSSADQQNKGLTDQICSAHVTSLEPLRVFHNFPDKSRLQGIIQAMPLLSPAPHPLKLHPLTSRSTFSLWALCTEPLSLLQSHIIICLCSSCFICIEHPSPCLSHMSNSSSSFRTQFIYQLYWEASLSPTIPLLQWQ